jgi:hypothetical protein
MIVLLNRKMGEIRPAAAWSYEASPSPLAAAAAAAAAAAVESGAGESAIQGRWCWHMDVASESTLVDLVMAELQSKLSALYYQHNATLEYSLGARDPATL